MSHDRAMAMAGGYVLIFIFVVTCAVSHAQVVPYKEKYFEQVVDHFSFYSKQYGRETFAQRYLIQDKWWDNGQGPIFFYTGNEGDITGFWDNSGFIFEIAPKFKALVVFAEHRFYGKSLPFGVDQSFQHPYVDLLTVEQAIADFAVLLTNLKQEWKATNCSVISFGGSYGGMLSAFFRIKYPNVIDGSLAASAPLLLVAGITSRDFFFHDVTQDFKNAISGCDSKIQHAFSEMESLAQQGAPGLKQISQMFNLCTPLEAGSYRHLLGWIRNAFTVLAMMDYPYKTSFLAPLPAYPVKVACQHVMDAKDAIQGLAAAAGMAYGNPKCHDIAAEYIECADPTGCGVGPNALAWDYQACTEMPMPAGTNNMTDMFPVLPFTPEERDAYCEQRWGVKGRPGWMDTNFWGKELQHTSNIILSNGDLDPWHRGGILQNISDSIVAIIIKGGAHHLDLRGTNPADPASVTEARQMETQLISKWLREAMCAKNPQC